MCWPLGNKQLLDPATDGKVMAVVSVQQQQRQQQRHNSPWPRLWCCS
jgi:hypothetical protein